MPLEPLPTAWFLGIVGALLIASALVSRLATRTGIPAVLLFLLIGMLAGSEGPGRIYFEDYRLSFRLGTAALVLILFDGGLNTSIAKLRQVLGPALTLATAGVVVTGLLVACGARLLGFAWGESLLLGAVVSSTDAAAVFSVLRGTGVRVRPRVARTLEVESGFNDPVAVVCTLALTEWLVARSDPDPGLILMPFVQLAIGAALGVLLGALGRWMLPRVRLASSGLYPVLTLAFALLSFGVATLLSGSGFLAVYLTGMVIGNGPLPHRGGLVRVHDFLAWTSQVLMFLTLGLLVFPSRLAAVAPAGLAIALWLILIARPGAVLLCLAPFRYTAGEMLMITWVGLKGAVPIILATFPVIAGLDESQRVFNVVFFVVVASVLLQGTTAGGLARRLGLGAPSPPAPPAELEISSLKPMKDDVTSYFVRADAAVAGAPVREIPMPPEAAIVLIARGTDLMSPAEGMLVQPGDHVYVISRPADRAEIRLLFGHHGED